MAKTKIEWTDYTINPIVGCSKISAGCKNCYAEKMAWRLKCMGIPKYQDVVDENGWTGRMHRDMTVFNGLPKKSKKVFVGSMCDLFHDQVPINWVGRILDKFIDYPQHTFMILTKRPKGMKWVFRNMPHVGFNSLNNTWLGVTAENQKRADERIPILLQIPAAVRFVSIEPMLERIDLTQYLHCGINWTIIGAESGPKKRFFDPKWAESIISQCKKANVPVFYKQDHQQKMPKVNGIAYAQFPNFTNKMKESL